MESILNNLNDLFLGNGLIIVLACMILGLFIKGSTIIPNRYIPFINIIISVILGFVIPNTFADYDIVSKVILLAFLGLSSVGLYEALCIVVQERFSISIEDIVNKYKK